MESIREVARLRERAALGEDSFCRFLGGGESQELVAAEIAAFSNSSGGTICFGLSEEGVFCGLDAADVRRINRLLLAAAASLQPPVTLQTRNLPLDGGRIVIAVTVPARDPLRRDGSGLFWVKNCADRTALSAEEARASRGLPDKAVAVASHPDSGTCQGAAPESADLRPVDGELGLIDTEELGNYVRSVLGRDWPDSAAERRNLMRSMRLARGSRPTVAGLLLLAARPQRLLPQARVVVRMVRNAFSGMEEREFTGPLRRVYEESFEYLQKSLAPSPEAWSGWGSHVVPAGVLTELLVNALVHRDYASPEPVVVELSLDSILITSPGSLPAALDRAALGMGVSLARNPVLVSHAGKGFLPYRGLGMGVCRAMQLWPYLSYRVQDDCVRVCVLRRPAEPGAWPLPDTAEQEGRETTAGSPASAGADSACRLGTAGQGEEGCDSRPGLSPAPDAACGTTCEGCGVTPTTQERQDGTGSDGKNGAAAQPPFDWNSREGREALQVYGFIEADADVRVGDIGKELGLCKRTVLKRVALLKEQGLVLRHGSSRGGRWEAVPEKAELCRLMVKGAATNRWSPMR